MDGICNTRGGNEFKMLVRNLIGSDYMGLSTILKWSLEKYGVRFGTDSQWSPTVAFCEQGSLKAGNFLTSWATINFSRTIRYNEVSQLVSEWVSEWVSESVSQSVSQLVS
jgi:hypothetical protein